MNLVTPPVVVSDLYYFLCGEKFINYTTKVNINNVKTKWHDGGYIIDKETEMVEIKKFVREMR